MEYIWYPFILMKINDNDLEFNGSLAVLLKFNRKWYSIIWNQFKLSKWIINMPVIKLSSIYYLEANDSESGLPRILALLKRSVKASFSLGSLQKFLIQKKEETLCCTYQKNTLIARNTLFCMTCIYMAYS